MPDIHQETANRIVAELSQDPRIAGVAAAGSWLRTQVLGPLLLMRSGQRPSGVRRIEQLLPRDSVILKSTLCGHDRASCSKALQAAIDLYRQLREGQGVTRSEAAEQAVTAYLDGVLGKVQARQL